jgi:hypothetical protein
MSSDSIVISIIIAISVILIQYIVDTFYKKKNEIKPILSIENIKLIIIILYRKI